MVTYRTICTEHIQHNNDDVIIMELGQLTKMEVFVDIFSIYRYFS